MIIKLIWVGFVYSQKFKILEIIDKENEIEIIITQSERSKLLLK
jgi:hypothetical protein